MLVKHTLSYLLARGGPGLIQFIAIAVFTRLVPPDEYGVYVLVVAGVGLANTIGFQWLRLGLLRFFHNADGRTTDLRASVGIGFIAMMAVSGGAVLLWLLLTQDVTRKPLVVLGLLILWAQAWFELNQETARARFSPRTYGILGLSRSLIYLGVGMMLTMWKGEANSLLLGILAGFAAPGLWMTFRDWRGIGRKNVDVALVRDLARYGLPLTATFVLASVVSMSDRLLLGFMMNGEAAGLYGVGYDLAQNSIGMLIMIVNLGALPLALRALEYDGESAARSQLAANGTFLLAIGVPAAVGVAILAEPIASVVVGGEFEAATASLLPWIALAALITGIRSYHFDLSFHLSKKTHLQTIALGGAAAVNITLNILLIPIYGIMGAAYSTLAAYAWALLASWIIGRRVFAVPVQGGELLRILAATTFMAGTLWPLRVSEGVLALALQVAVGSVAFAVAALVLNIGGVRSALNEMRLNRKPWIPNF